MTLTGPAPSRATPAREAPSSPLGPALAPVPASQAPEPGWAGYQADEAHPTQLKPWHVGLAGLFLLGACLASLVTGPADLPVLGVLKAIVGQLPLVHLRSGLGPTGDAVVWQLRMPEVALGCLVGATLAVAGASYQGVFSNPLADPYLLGVAAGAGLGATIAIIAAPSLTQLPVSPLPLCAFVGALAAVGATFVLGRGRATSAGPAALLLGGVAVAAFFTAVQTFLQQQHSQDIQAIYGWVLGSLATPGWASVELAAPYVGVALVVLLGCRRLLDVLSLGDDEAASVGVNAPRVRLAVISAATLGTAAAVSVSGLIGFVGIIVPHTLRLLGGTSYRRILPLSVLCGAGFLVLANVVANSVLSPAEVPLGVVTACLGAPFFLFVLRRSRLCL